MYVLYQFSSASLQVVCEFNPRASYVTNISQGQALIYLNLEQ
jgi:hypothetical protein